MVRRIAAVERELLDPGGHEDRKHVDEALRESEERLRTVVSNAPIILFAVDKEGVFTLSEGRGLDTLGLKPGDVVGRSVFDVFPEVSQIPEEFRRALAGEAFNSVLDVAGGTLESWYHPLRDANGEVIGVIGVSMAITERQRSEAALRESEEKYRRLVQDASEGIAIVAGLEVKFVNRALLKMYGGESEEEMVGRPLTDLVAPEHRELMVERSFAREKGQDVPAQYEFKALRKDGTKFDAELSVSLITYEGRVARQGVIRDITERKQVEEALRESEARYRLLAENTSDLIWTMDLSLRYTYMSPAVTRMRGYSVEEIVGTTVQETMTPASLEVASKALAEELAIERTEQKDPFRSRKVELEMYCRDGSTIWTEMNMTFLRDSDGRPVGILGVTRDISERRKAERELLRQGAVLGVINKVLLETLSCETDTDVARVCIEEAQGLTSSDFGFIGEINQAGRFDTIALTDPGWEACRMPRSSGVRMIRDMELRGIWSKVLKDERAVIVNDPASHPDRVGTPEGHPPLTSFLGVPLKDRGKTIGMIGLANKESGYDVADQENVEAISTAFVEALNRKRAEEALQESEGRYRLLAENVSDVIFTTDLSIRYTYVSPSVTRMRGYSVEEVMASTLVESLAPASLEEARKVIAEELAKEKAGQRNLSRTVEVELNRKDGSTIWAEVTATFLRDADGNPIGLLGISRDISERKRAEEERKRLHSELETRAITDSLTGLYNHAYFYQRLADEIDRSRRYGHRFALVMMDLDAFKHYNDSRGHQAGDAALRLVGECIQSAMRRSDLAFRYGGDEFVAILLNADVSKAQNIVRRINKRIATRLKEMGDSAGAWLGVSAGIACFPEDATTVDELVRMADAAMYDAKRLAWARGVMGRAQAVESGACPVETVHETQTRMLSGAANSLAAALQDLTAPEVVAESDLRTIAALGAAAEIKDPYIRGHQERTSRLAATVANEMGLSPDRVRSLTTAGLLHDLGKISVSESILNKPGKLTESEFAKMKEHPALGATMIVSGAEALQPVAPIVRHHHERVDGNGYPDGLARENIPLEARILSVADAFDAMTHERAYRKALSAEEALGEIERGAGTRFDPAVVEAFLALESRGFREPAVPW
jgi:diguanylate cyclase (GGDEF)-like protein/PAS domain S-box-containing protein